MDSSIKAEKKVGLIHETKIPMLELEPKVQELGLYAEGGWERICGILLYSYIQIVFTIARAITGHTHTSKNSNYCPNCTLKCVINYTNITSRCSQYYLYKRVAMYVSFIA